MTDIDICVVAPQACSNQSPESLIIAASAPAGQVLQQAAEQVCLPFKPVLKAEDDKALFAKIRERLISPQRLKISLDDL